MCKKYVLHSDSTNPFIAKLVGKLHVSLTLHTFDNIYREKMTRKNEQNRIRWYNVTTI